MSSTVLLISANRCTTPEPVFPLGLACLNAALRRAGHRTVWFDCLADRQRLEDVLAACRPDFAALSIRNIDDIGWRTRETFFGDLPGLAARIREASGARLILGGSGFSIFPQPLFELAGADFGICGAGESALVELIGALHEGRPFRHISGLVFRENGGVVMNPPLSQPVDQELTEADRPGAVVEHYLRASGMLNVQTQRGCAFRCCYCTYPAIEGKRLWRRPPEAVAAEFAQLERLGARYVFITDSVFNSSAQHVAAVCEALLRREVKVSWGCFLRPQGLTGELMKLMVRAGLAHIEFGSDSFCDEVLAEYHKDFTFDDIRSCSELAQRERVNYCHYLIAGGPGETPETLRRSYEASQRLRGAIILAVIGMRIYPATPLFERAVAEGRLKREADLLTPVYYLAPGLTSEGVFNQLRAFGGRSPNWIVGDPSPAYAGWVERLRQRGVVGPLWSYFAVLQRLWPEGRGGEPGWAQSVPHLV
jgi:radical SAM superfamily enzyme YgiQ (UPF0313 family)